MSEETYFEDVPQHEQVQAVAHAHGFEPVECWIQGGGTASAVKGTYLRNNGFKYRKDEWLIHLPARGVVGIDTNFQSRRPGCFQVDVEVYPYEGSLARKPERQEELRSQLELKAQLIEIIRPKLLSDPICKRELKASTKHLRSASWPSTLCAVQFEFPHNSATCASIASYAAFFARVIAHVSPMLDRIIADARRQITDTGQAATQRRG